jgi:hypothetical protein
MRFSPGLMLVTLGCFATAGGVTYWLTQDDDAERLQPVDQAARVNTQAATQGILPPPYPNPALTTFPDPTAPPGSSAQVFVDPQAFDALVGAATAQFTDHVRDEGSLTEYREVISHRAERAKAILRERSQLVHLDPTPTYDQALQALWIYRQFAFVAL